MKEKQNAPTGVATSARAKERTAMAGASVSCADCNTGDGLIASLLRMRDEHIPAQEIARALGVADARVVTRLVQRERLGGAPICASCNGKGPGFFLAQTPQELERYIRSLRRRVKAVSSTLAALEATHDAWTGQQRLDLDEGEVKA